MNRPPATDFEEPKYLPIADAARQAHRSLRTIKRWIKSGDLPTRRGLVREDHLLNCERLQAKRLADGCKKPRLRNHDLADLVRSA